MMKTMTENTAAIVLGLLFLTTMVEAQDIWPPVDEVAPVPGTHIASMVLERHRNGAWEDSKKEDYIYDESGMLVEKIFSSIHDDGWRVTRRERFSYSDTMLVTLLKEDKRVKIFHPSEQRSYAYEDGRLSLETIDAYGPGAQVIPVFRFSYAYDDNDSLSYRTIVQRQSMEGAWKEIKTVNRTSAADGRILLQTKSESRRGAEPSVTDKFEYEYDDDGRLISRRWQILGDDGWATPLEEEYAYGDDTTTIVASYTYGGQTAKTHRIVLSHDPNGNVATRLYQGWQGDTWVDGRRENYTYASSH